jgi:hypothetical protein
LGTDTPPPRDQWVISTKGIGGSGVKKGVEHEYDMPLVTTVGSSVGERGRRSLTTTCRKKHGVVDCHIMALEPIGSFQLRASVVLV